MDRKQNKNIYVYMYLWFMAEIQNIYQIEFSAPFELKQSVS